MGIATLKLEVQLKGSYYGNTATEPVSFDGVTACLFAYSYCAVNAGVLLKTSGLACRWVF